MSNLEAQKPKRIEETKILFFYFILNKKLNLDTSISSGFLAPKLALRLILVPTIKWSHYCPWSPLIYHNALVNSTATSTRHINFFKKNIFKMKRDVLLEIKINQTHNSANKNYMIYKSN